MTAAPWAGTCRSPRNRVPGAVEEAAVAASAGPVAGSAGGEDLETAVRAVEAVVVTDGRAPSRCTARRCGSGQPPGRAPTEEPQRGIHSGLVLLNFVELPVHFFHQVVEV